MKSNWTLMNYRELKKQIKNAVSELGTILELKGVVSATNKLPLTGNKKGDVYIVSEDNTEYVWTSDNASGLITDYEELGPVVAANPSSGGGVLVVTATNGTLDKTWQEIHDAFVAGSVRIQNETGSIMNVKIVGHSSREGTYSVACENYQTDETYTTDSASGYPAK